MLFFDLNSHNFDFGVGLEVLVDEYQINLFIQTD